MRNKLSKTERKIARSIKKGEWKPLGEKSRKEYAALAKRQIKEARINIRIPSDTLERIQREALDMGMPYQTLIASILYRYSHDRLYDERVIQQTLDLLNK